eukprot:jgi/Psemu1/200556/e_gw1.260.11.1
MLRRTIALLFFRFLVLAKSVAVTTESLDGVKSRSTFYSLLPQSRIGNSNDENVSFDPNVTEYWFDTVVDHFNFRPTAQATFPLRYFVNDQYYGNSSSPVIFYAGNEAPITQFLENSGFLWEAAKKLQGMVVFAEHRYYGKSFPFGSPNAALTPQNISFLTVEQAMADFNTLQVHIRKEWSMQRDAAFLVTGGSYGGNLALWLRLKNPNLWAGALASSATPLKHLLRESNAFSKIVADVYGNISATCPDKIRNGWKDLFELVKSEEGRQTVQTELKLCHLPPLEESEPEAVANEIYGWISGALETMVQYGYPYPTEFYNPVPGYPFRVACENMLLEKTALGALRAAAQDDLVGTAWNYQCCTEVYQPMPTNGVTDLELPHQPNKTEYFERCRKRWDGVEPRPDWEEMTFMSNNIQAGSNLFLTSGQLDPWRAAGIQSLPRNADPESIVVRIIEDGAHHLDLRSSHPLDPPSVTSVRSEELKSFEGWVRQWRELYPPIFASEEKGVTTGLRGKVVA